MSQPQRLNQVLELLSRRGSVTIAELSEELGISIATARRDLGALADQRLLTRTRGGATTLGSGYELPLQYKAGRQADAKLAIAQAVSGLVTPGATVGLNGGTTATEVARALGRAGHLMRPGVEPGLTIVTNALNIAYELSVRDHVRLVVTGGIPRRQSYELVGPLVGRSLQGFTLDLAVLGADGLTGQFGATTLNEAEAEASKLLAASAQRVVLAVDSTKFGRVTFARILDLAQVDVLVTDSQVPPELAADLAANGVDVLVASAGPDRGIAR